MKRHHPWHRHAIQALARTHRRAFSAGDLQELLRELQENTEVPEKISVRRFIDFLKEEAGLREEEIHARPLPGETSPLYRPFHRLILGKPSPEELALTFRPRSYLSHASALRGHGIACAPDLPVYVNQEQSPKPSPSGTLSQHAIDRAFGNRARESRYVYNYCSTDLVLLSGKQTSNHRVIQIEHPGAEIRLPTTDLPRTLVDVTVRPVYAGGPTGVLAAYRDALRRVDPEVLVADMIETLEKLGHLYPYHQAIGYYLSRTGVAKHHLIRLHKMGTEHDFYLCNQIPKPIYDSVWRIHVPAEIVESQDQPFDLR